MVPTTNMLFYFFSKSKIYNRKIWISLSSVGDRNLLTLFQSSYKKFRSNFVKSCASEQCPSLLDSFPLYWSTTPHPQGARSLDELDEVE